MHALRQSCMRYGSQWQASRNCPHNRYHCVICILNLTQDMKDQEMVEMKERMVIVEEGLRRKEAELAEIRAAEEQRERENACIDELQSRVLELEGAIKERDEKEDGMDTERDAEDKVDELAALKGALEESQKELAQHMTRADGAEVRALGYRSKYSFSVRGWLVRAPLSSVFFSGTGLQ